MTAPSITAPGPERLPPASVPDATEGSEQTTIVYDGACPVCTAYSCAMENDQSVRLIDARQGGTVVERLIGEGYDLDEGMVVLRGGQTHHGADAIHAMALGDSRRGALAALNRRVFGSAARSRRLYPALRFGRNLLLRLLGREPIAVARAKPPV